jgi:hypothetical protein
VAIKFEAATSKGLAQNGTPHEWGVYAKLGALYGIPRIFARGRLGDYFTMVHACSGSPFCAPLLARLRTCMPWAPLLP